MSAPPGTVGAVLDATAAQTRRVIDAHLAAREPREWLWDLMVEYPARGGKAIRPSLCVASCRAFGGRTEDALPSAAALELLHNAFLIHDDIEDGSSKRRGRPTLHEMAGVPLALNAGDALLVEAIALLRANRAALGSRMAARVLGEFERTVRRTVQGQAMELGWRRERRFDITADQYVDLIVRKTCWYTTIHPLRVGALIGGWNRVPLEPVVRFGTYLGAAFQLQDDLLNLVGDERVYGKEILGDLHEGKCTLVLAHLMTTLDEHERADLVHGFFAAPRAQRSDADVRRILAMMHDRGSIEAARGFADGIASLAVGAFDEAFAPAPPSPDRDFLRDMVDYMLNRDR